MAGVRTRGLWRWAVVAAAAVLAVGAPVAVTALRAPSGTVDAPGLRARVMASTAQPHQGYGGDHRHRCRCPTLPKLEDVTALLTGTTTVRSWYAVAGAVAVRRGVHRRRARHLPARPTASSSGTTARTSSPSSSASPPVRLPRAGDLLPPDLARGCWRRPRATPVTALPARPVAGRRAAGLRLVPGGPGHDDRARSTSGRIAETGLPVPVEVTPRGAARPVLVTASSS